LRIKPEADGSYSIPAGNLFPADGSLGRPEIYIMGNRNPYRISIDSETGWLYWGDVGPDASFDSASRGPRGYDEINQARDAGNYGWPYVIADNKAYRDYDFATGLSGPAFDPTAIENNSPNNTGSLDLPGAQEAFIWYPYSTSMALNPFPELITGTTGRTAMAGPVYHFDSTLNSDIKLPEYFDDTLVIYDWSRDAFWEVKLDLNGQVFKINRMFRDLPFDKPIDAELGPDGALYVLEWGDDNGPFQGNNPDAKLVRVEFIGNLPNLIGDYNRNNVVDAADFTLWRNTLGQASANPFAGADGSGNGAIGPEDYDIWKSHFGETLVQGTGSSFPHSLSTQPEPTAAEPSTFGERQATKPTDRTTVWPGRAATASPVRSPSPVRPLESPQRDEALLAWLAASAEVNPSSGIGEFERFEANTESEEFLDSVSAVFQLLGNLE
jgi:hypothetical protein